jgi:hypothetical protein
MSSVATSNVNSSSLTLATMLGLDDSFECSFSMVFSLHTTFMTARHKIMGFHLDKLHSPGTSNIPKAFNSYKSAQK